MLDNILDMLCGIILAEREMVLILLLLTKMFDSLYITVSRPFKFCPRLNELTMGV
jgi:hypothetical protein